MSTLPLEIYNLKQIREIERLTISKKGISEALLMERAGQAAYETLLFMQEELDSIAVFCGKGNNGGDGYVLARLAHEDGIDVTVYSLAKISELTATARAAESACREAGVLILPFSATKDIDIEVDVIVDAILGIGAKGQMHGDALKAIQLMNNTEAAVLSLDIPSGLDADTGEVLGEAVIANQTITFIGLKQGLHTGKGMAYCGKMHCDTLAIGEEIFAAVDNCAYRMELSELENYLLPRHAYAHKGDFGRVLIVGGDYGMAGAVRMAGEAALRVGAGAVTVATRPEHIAVVVANRPELMCYPIHQASDLAPLIAAADVIVCGPGLGQSEWSKQLYDLVLASKKPTVMDASALHFLAAQPSTSEQWVLTPHPGEAAALLATDVAHIQKNRYAAVEQLQQRYKSIVVLKGAGSIVTGQDMLPEVCFAGNPGMATAGMGDILAGIIAGLVAQHFSLEDAARFGVCIHAQAGDNAAEHGERGLLASDLLDELRDLVNPLQENTNHELEHLLDDLCDDENCDHDHDEDDEDFWDEITDEHDQDKVH